MSTEALLKVYLRDLNKLIHEVELYKKEEDLWLHAPGISNSGGNLTLHLIGNLNHFIGTILGQTNYVRQRDKEFNDTGVSKAKLVADINDVMEILKQVLPSIPPSRLSEAFPQKIGDAEFSVEEMLLHLLSHLGYHLGQINYHRRLLSQ